MNVRDESYRTELTSSLIDWTARLHRLLDVNRTVQGFTVEFKGGAELRVDREGASLTVAGETVGIDTFVAADERWAVSS